MSNWYSFFALTLCTAIAGCDNQGSVGSQETIVVRDTVFIEVEPPNRAPSILEISITPPFAVAENGFATDIIVTVVATDPDGDELDYFWSANAGSIVTRFSGYSTTTNPAWWEPPGVPGMYEVKCTVSDGIGTRELTVMIEVR